MAPRNVNIRLMLDELQSLGHGLSKWEQQFLEDITDHVERGGKLNDDQYRKLTEIYNERVR